jgi:hypothetical protein
LLLTAFNFLTADILFADSFDSLKKAYSSARLLNLEAEIIVTSEIFNDIDTVRANLSIANDGRYIAIMDEDMYLYDGTCLWDYSSENNQATKDCIKDGESFENDLVFLKDFDRYYKSSVMIEDSLYYLKKIVKSNNSLPDSLVIYLSGSGISAVQYNDLNDDLNQIFITRTIIADTLIPDLFKIRLPDSAEIIVLP